MHGYLQLGRVLAGGRDDDARGDGPDLLPSLEAALVGRERTRRGLDWRFEKRSASSMRIDSTVAVEPSVRRSEKVSVPGLPGARSRSTSLAGSATTSTSSEPFIVSVKRGCSGSLLSTTMFLVLSVCCPLGRSVTLILPSPPGGITSSEMTAAVQDEAAVRREHG
jgi:hypothetical protein